MATDAAPPAAPPAPKVKVVETRAPARPARLKLRHILVMFSFLLCVVAPTAVAGFYLYTYAADQYASKVGFTVRREETSSAMELLGGLTSMSTSSSSDTDILYEFIQSQELVRAIDDTLDLHALYGKPEQDVVFRLDEGASIEDLVDYWADMVRIFYDPGTGLIEVEVRAFDPQDARAVAQELFRRSSAMINELSSVAREDTTRYARQELDQAVERLKEARRALTLFRNETQIVDPSADIQGQMGLLNSLQAQLADALIELDLLAGTVRESDPRAEQARRRIEVINTRIEEERRKLGVSGTGVGSGEAFADLVGQFESLSVDLRFAEQAYVSALSAFDTAVAEARRQSRYLAAYLQPTLAETPQYPQRETLLAVLALILFGAWTVTVLVYYSLKDRR